MYLFFCGVHGWKVKKSLEIARDQPFLHSHNVIVKASTQANDFNLGKKVS
jgi:hypothetical protein